MKKKILSLVLAAAMLASFMTAFAENKTDRAIIMCYDGGKLVYAKLVQSDNIVIDAGEVSSQYEKTKIYYIDEQKFEDFNSSAAPEPTEAPVQTAVPEVTAKPVNTATAKPTKAPAADTPYEKEVDAIYALALVTNVAAGIDANNGEVVSLKLLYRGKESGADIAKDIKISSAPDAYSHLAGASADSLKKGDVICMSANIAGTKIKTIDLLFRPVSEDIVTGGADYGADFEKLFTTDGTVANQWQHLKYGTTASKGSRYQYAFGVVASSNKNSITLLNKSTNPNDALEIDVNPEAYVYICDTCGKDYEFELGGVNDIAGTIPASLLREDEIILGDTYSYNYAFVRVVDGTATDIVLFNNYNY